LDIGNIILMKNYIYLQKRLISHAHGSHGQPGIKIAYELSPVMVDAGQAEDDTFIRLLVRCCACVGGVVATSVFLFTFLKSWIPFL
jgi:hypothetical protein